MINVLLLSSGTNACYHFAKVIKEKFPSFFRLVGADVNDYWLVPTSRYLDKTYKVRYNSDPLYYQEIIDICKKEHIKYLLPSFDNDQKLFYQDNIDLINLGVISFASKKDTLYYYSDKRKMNDFLFKNSFPIPRIFNNVNQLSENTLYIVKPINGVGSIGVKTLSSYDICNIKNINDFLVEEKCHGPEITVECFYWEKTLECVCRERIQSKAGVCTKARVFCNKNLKQIAERFAKLIGCPIVFNLQFMMNKKDEYVITDVNLRLAGGMGLSYAAGWDIVSSIAKVMLGFSGDDIFTSLRMNISDVFVVRAYEDFVIKKK